MYREKDTTLLLTITCPDQVGIVAEVSRFLAERRCNIVESAQFEDRLNSMFFMRVAFVLDAPGQKAALRSAFLPIADRLRMKWELVPRFQSVRTLIMVSKFGHCRLNDLVSRHKIDALPIDVVGVVSNHTTFERFCDANGVPFRHIPITAETKREGEAQLIQMIEDQQIGLVVLARYMQVLSDDLCSRYPGRIINIHHSLLPSFMEAKPYHRAP